MTGALFSFGTAGIRARAGGADHELNPRTVRAIAEAVLGYLATLAPDALARGVCVGFDGRRDSAAFASVVCEAAAARGFSVHAFPAPVPTPLLAFATRRRGSIAGFMITASHNPPADNGIKLYLEGGRQIGAPHDASIEARLAAPPEPAAPCPSAHPAITLGRADEDAYLAALALLLPPERDAPLPVLAYSATCGVGSPLTRRVLALAGAEAYEVAEQAEPRADFGGLASPNPEHEPALAALRARAEQVNAAVAFAHDPDADRLAVLARDPAGTLVALTGDEVGALLGDYLLARSADPRRELVATSHVSGDLLMRVAAARGSHCLRTATGFKHIAEGARRSAEALSAHVLFAYEEAIGYALGDLGDDKDGVAALYVMLGLVRDAAARGETLRTRIEALWLQHGVHLSRQVSLTLDGAAGLAQRDALFARFAALPTAELLGEPGSLRDHRLTRAPSTLLEHVGASLRLCVRPSGTEPKLKLYLHARGAPCAPAELASEQARLAAQLDGLATRARAVLAG
jgi:phosphomannomutase